MSKPTSTAPEIERMLPLYQGMMTTFYDHRAADIIKSETATLRQTQPRYLSDEEKSNPNRLVQPMYWVRESLLDNNLPAWYVVFSNITGMTNERTLITGAAPRVGIGNSLSLLLTSNTSDLSYCLLACLSSFVVDYQARQKMGGTTLNYFYAKQFPALPPKRFQERARWGSGQTLSEWIAPRVSELVATAADMTSLASELGYSWAPFKWDPARRAMLRAELDAAFFHLYGIDEEDVDYIMETFPIVKRKDEAAYGEYRTKRLVLERYSALAAAIQSGTPYQTPLDPPPASPAQSAAG